MRKLNKTSRTFWARKLLKEHRNSVASIFKVGQTLIDAKAALAHGEWEKFVEHDLPFCVRTAQRYMAIAADHRLSKATVVSLLPPSSTILYNISRLSDRQLDAALTDGTINPDMTDSDVLHILGPPLPEPRPVPWAKPPHALNIPAKREPPQLPPFGEPRRPVPLLHAQFLPAPVREARDLDNAIEWAVDRIKFLVERAKAMTSIEPQTLFALDDAVLIMREAADRLTTVIERTKSNMEAAE
jgi:hypothetical protein